MVDFMYRLILSADLMLYIVVCGVVLVLFLCGVVLGAFSLFLFV